jgi:hypothetical protein
MYCVLSGEAANTNCIVFGLIQGLKPTIYCALEACTLTITPLMQSKMMAQGQMFYNYLGGGNVCLVTGHWWSLHDCCVCLLCLMPFSTIFQLYHGRNKRKPLTCKSLTNFITYCCIEYNSPWLVFELTTLVVIDTDSMGSCKSNYHTFTGSSQNV